VGGWLAGLPLTSAPVSLILAIEHGPEFAARAAIGTLLGLVSLAVFALAYRVAAPHTAWAGCVLTGLGGFAATTALLGGLGLLSERVLPVGIAFGLVCIALATVAALMAWGAEVRRAPRLLPGDLALRMTLAAAMVLAITSLAALAGPELAGSLSPIPVFGALLAAFAHRDQGAGAAVQVLRGMVSGSYGFATFLLVVASLLGRLGLAPTYALAAAAALGVHALTLVLVRPRA
jgi:hypothetical protein